MLNDADKKILFDTLLLRIAEIVREDIKKDDKLFAICYLLKKEIPYYDWVGFYLVEPKKKEELVKLLFWRFNSRNSKSFFKCRPDSNGIFISFNTNIRFKYFRSFLIIQR